jgi:hypothetical protein
LSASVPANSSAPTPIPIPWVADSSGATSASRRDSTTTTMSATTTASSQPGRSRNEKDVPS